MNLVDASYSLAIRFRPAEVSDCLGQSRPKGCAEGGRSSQV